MALSAIMRRSASRAAPLAARLIQTGPPKPTHFPKLPSALFSTTAFTSRPAANYVSTPRRHFSSASDSNLVQVLQNEVECTLESDAKELDVPSDFPFTILDNSGESIITLTREHEGETITVEVSMPDLVTGEDDDEDKVEENDGDQEGGSASSLPLIVTIAKKNGTSLEFDVTAYPDEIRINALSLKKPESDESEYEPVEYDGPDFLDLDENLQEAFHKYLEIRGIKPATTNFLHEYMIEKDSKEYLRWLKDVKKFVEA